MMTDCDVGKSGITSSETGLAGMKYSVSIVDVCEDWNQQRLEYASEHRKNTDGTDRLRIGRLILGLGKQIDDAAVPIPWSKDRIDTMSEQMDEELWESRR